MSNDSSYYNANTNRKEKQITYDNLVSEKTRCDLDPFAVVDSKKF